MERRGEASLGDIEAQLAALRQRIPVKALPPRSHMTVPKPQTATKHQVSSLVAHGAFHIDAMAGLGDDATATDPDLLKYVRSATRSARESFQGIDEYAYNAEEEDTSNAERLMRDGIPVTTARNDPFVFKAVLVETSRTRPGSSATTVSSPGTAGRTTARSNAPSVALSSASGQHFDHLYDANTVLPGGKPDRSGVASRVVRKPLNTSAISLRNTPSKQGYTVGGAPVPSPPRPPVPNIALKAVELRPPSTYTKVSDGFVWLCCGKVNLDRAAVCSVCGRSLEEKVLEEQSEAAGSHHVGTGDASPAAAGGGGRLWGPRQAEEADAAEFRAAVNAWRQGDGDAGAAPPDAPAAGLLPSRERMSAAVRQWNVATAAMGSTMYFTHLWDQCMQTPSNA